MLQSPWGPQTRVTSSTSSRERTLPSASVPVPCLGELGGTSANREPPTAGGGRRRDAHPPLPSLPPLQVDLEDMADLLEMREEVSNLVIGAMKEAEEYQDSLERYSYLWAESLQESMRNFLLYGRAVTSDDLDVRAEEPLPKAPPTLAQFQQQVRGGRAPVEGRGLGRGPGWMTVQCQSHCCSGGVWPSDQGTATDAKCL